MLDENLVFLGVMFIAHMLFCGLLVYVLLFRMEKMLESKRVFEKAKTVEEAVAATAILENERKPPEPAKEPLKVPVGFRDQAGRVIKFMTRVDDKLLATIPKERLVYE